jgi:hypothetical protein
MLRSNLCGEDLQSMGVQCQVIDDAIFVKLSIPFVAVQRLKLLIIPDFTILHLQHGLNLDESRL